MFRVVSPVNRMAVGAFVWSHRRTIMRWGRSLVTELRSTRRSDPRRWWTIVRVLWAITGDESLARAPQLRRVELDGDVLVVDVPASWRGRHRLADLLASVDGIRRVEDTAGRELQTSIEVSAV